MCDRGENRSSKFRWRRYTRRHADRIYCFFDIVYPNDLGAVHNRDNSRGQAAAEPLTRWNVSEYLSDERFSRSSDQNGILFELGYDFTKFRDQL